MSEVTWLNKFHCLCWCYGFGETERTTERMAIKTDPEDVSEVFPLVQIHKHNKKYISPAITMSKKHGKLVHKLHLYVIFHFLLQIFKSFVVWLKRDHAYESYKIKIKKTCQFHYWLFSIHSPWQETYIQNTNKNKNDKIK